MAKGLLIMFFVLFFIHSSGYSQSPADPSIRDWGNTYGTSPLWQSADVWCDNNGDDIHNDIGEPSKGMVNRLFARIRNLGGTTATNVKVTFAYAPYGAWQWSSYPDFMLIDEASGITLTAAGTPDCEKTIEVAWDLTNLSENNGAKWGGYTVADFDHFCVWIKVEAGGGGDALPNNNDARNNFTGVSVAAGTSSAFHFMIVNPDEKNSAEAALVLNGMPENWRFRVQGIDDYRKFSLKPKEKRMLTFSFRPVVTGRDLRINQNVDVSLKLNGKIGGGISFLATNVPVAKIVYSPADGMLSPYLTGVYDKRNEANAWILIVNPTGGPLLVRVAFFDDKSNFIICREKRLGPNGLWEIDLQSNDDPELHKILEGRFGVVKAVSYGPGNGYHTRYPELMPKRGIVGYQRHSVKDNNWSEAPMFSVPTDILMGDLKNIPNKCK